MSEFQQCYQTIDSSYTHCGMGRFDSHDIEIGLPRSARGRASASVSQRSGELQGSAVFLSEGFCGQGVAGGGAVYQQEWLLGPVFNDRVGSAGDYVYTKGEVKRNSPTLCADSKRGWVCMRVLAFWRTGKRMITGLLDAREGDWRLEGSTQRAKQGSVQQCITQVQVPGTRWGAQAKSDRHPAHYSISLGRGRYTQADAG